MPYQHQAADFVRHTDDATGDALPGSRPAQARGLLRELSALVDLASDALDRAAGETALTATPRLAPLIGTARAALEHANALVRNASPPSVHAGDGPESADIAACLAEVATRIRDTSPPGIDVRLSLERGIPAACCDYEGLRSAVLALVANAREAMPDGGVIRISAAATFRGASGIAIIRVADDGIGMAAGTVERAFDPFFTTKGGGLGGMGLPMARQFAKRHGGDIDIRSAAGAGTTAILRLPASRVSPPVKGAGS